MTVLELALEVLTRAYPNSVPVGVISSALGHETSQVVSTAMSKALAAGDERFVRTDRGVYRAAVTMTVTALENEDVMFAAGRTVDEHLAEIEEEPPARKEAGRIRRVRQRITDLERALDDLSHYMTKVEAKARAYDKIQYAMNGVVEDPM